MISISMASSFFLTKKTKYKFLIPKIFRELRRKARSLIMKRISRRLVKQSKNRIVSIGHRVSKLRIEPAITRECHRVFVLSSHTRAPMPPSWFPIITTPSMITWHFARRMAQRPEIAYKGSLNVRFKNRDTHRISVSTFPLS